MFETKLAQAGPQDEKIEYINRNYFVTGHIKKVPAHQIAKLSSVGQLIPVAGFSDYEELVRANLRIGRSVIPVAKSTIDDMVYFSRIDASEISENNIPDYIYVINMANRLEYIGIDDEQYVNMCLNQYTSAAQDGVYAVTLEFFKQANERSTPIRTKVIVLPEQFIGRDTAIMQMNAHIESVVFSLTADQDCPMPMHRM